MTERHLLGGCDAKKKKKKEKIRRLFTAGTLAMLATRPPLCPSPTASLSSFLPAPCCQLPKDICTHPLLNEKVLMHVFRLCQNIQDLQVFGDAAMKRRDDHGENK